jgi:hypothetical protein
VLWRCLYRLRREGKRFPVAMVINGYSALIAIKRRVKVRETVGLKRGSEGRGSLRLDGAV